MATAGYPIKFKRSGTSTSFSDEGMTEISDTEFTITDGNKTVWDTDGTFTFYEDDVLIPSSDIVSINYLFGSVVFSSAMSGAITVAGDFLPMADIGGAKSGSFNRTAQILDSTDISNVGYHTKEYGFLDVTISVDRFDTLDDAHVNILTSREPVYIEIAPSPTRSYRGRFVCESANSNLDKDSLLEESASFQLSATDDIFKSYSHN